MNGLFRSNLRFSIFQIYRIRSISICQVSPSDHKKRQLRASMQKYEMKRKLREIQKQELKQQEEVKQIGKEYKSSVERSLFSLLFSNKIDYKVRDNPSITGGRISGRQLFFGQNGRHLLFSKKNWTCTFFAEMKN